MRSLFDQNHYQVLETHRSATPEQIEHSYRMALATYSDDSLAGYSVFSEGDSSAICERIEIAYRVLCDEAARSEYDETLEGEGELGMTSDAAASNPRRPAAPLLSIDESPRDLVPVPEFDEPDGGTGDYDGARLRRYRLRCGMELKEALNRLGRWAEAAGGEDE